MKRLLIIKASQDVCGEELDLIQAQARMLGVDVVQKKADSPEELESVLKGAGRVDYFYLCSHGNREVFQLGATEMSWSELGALTCVSGCLRSGSTFLMACCRGGLNRVAYDMFIACPEIDFIFGPSSVAFPTDLTTAFSVFLTQLETKGADQTHAARKASLAIDREFICFDRNVVEGQADYTLRLKELRRSWGLDEFGVPMLAGAVRL
jgi:hypothetical protein